MTDQQIQDCMGEIYAAVNEARQGNKTKLQFLAIGELYYREASAIANAKGYHYHEMGTTLPELVQLLPDKRPERSEKRCATCEHWRCLHIPSSPNLGTCVFSYNHLQTTSLLKVLLRDGQFECPTYRQKRT